MAKDIRVCEYHGKFEAGEWNDWQCPKCAKEIFDYAKFSHSRDEKDLNKNVKNILKRAGMNV